VPATDSNPISPDTIRTEHTAVELGLFDQNKEALEEVETKWTFKAPSVER